ncbi:MAG: hypothetical protein HY529_03100 [Chloroflexi bacterium]|nr:hypothetical protein [Chloroflexota bacterium]
MLKRNVRVVVASEYPRARDFLKGVVEGEEGGVIVGQAPDATRALTLTRNLRPDAVIIDCYLPHTVGLDTIPLSRMGGLDTAQAIAEEIPNTQVILLRNLDLKHLPEYSLGRDSVSSFSREKLGVNTPFKLHELFQSNMVSPNDLVFADIVVKPRAVPTQKGNSATDKIMLFGGLGVLGGWFLILTIFFAPVGIFVALAGGVTMLLGLAVRLMNSLKSKSSSKAL